MKTVVECAQLRAEDCPISGNCVKPSQNRSENDYISVTPTHLKFSFDNVLEHVTPITIWNKTKQHVRFRITVPQTDIFQVFCDKFDLYAQSEGTAYVKCKPHGSRICVDCIEIQVTGQPGIRILLELLPSVDWFILPKFINLPVAPLCTRVEGRINLPVPRGQEHVYRFSVVSPLNPIFNVTPRTGTIGGMDGGVKFLKLSFISNEYLTLTYKLLIRFTGVDCQPYEVDVFGRCAPNIIGGGVRKDVLQIERLSCELAAEKNQVSSKKKEPRFRLVSKKDANQSLLSPDDLALDCSNEEMRKLLSPAGIMKFLIQKDSQCKDTSSLMLGPLGVEMQKSVASYNQKKGEFVNRLNKQNIQHSGLLCLHSKERLGEESIANQPQLIEQITMDREKYASEYEKALGLTENESEDMTRLRAKKFNQRQVRNANADQNQNNFPQFSPENFEDEYDQFQKGLESVKQSILQPFIQAARTILTRWRVDNRLKRLKKLVKDQKEKLKAEELERLENEKNSRPSKFQCPDYDDADYEDEEFTWKMNRLKEQLKNKELKAMIDAINEKLKKLKGKVNENIQKMVDSLKKDENENVADEHDENDDHRLKIKADEESLEKKRKEDLRDKMAQINERIQQLQGKIQDAEEKAEEERQKKAKSLTEAALYEKLAEAERQRQERDEFVANEIESLAFGPSALKNKDKDEEVRVKGILESINKAIENLTDKLHHTHPQIESLQKELNDEISKLLEKNLKPNLNQEQPISESILEMARRGSENGKPNSNLLKYLRQMNELELLQHQNEIQGKFNKLAPKYKTAKVRQIQDGIRSAIEKLIEQLGEEKDDPSGENRALKGALAKINMAIDAIQDKIENSELENIQNRLNDTINKMLKKTPPKKSRENESQSENKTGAEIGNLDKSKPKAKEEKVSSSRKMSQKSGTFDQSQPKMAISSESFKNHETLLNQGFHEIPLKYRNKEIKQAQKDINDLLENLMRQNANKDKKQSLSGKSPRGSFMASLKDFKSQFGAEIQDLQQSIIEGVRKSIDDPNISQDKKTLDNIQSQLTELENETEAQVAALKKEEEALLDEEGKNILTRIHSEIDKLQDTLEFHPELDNLQGDLHKEILSILGLPSDHADFGYNPKEREIQKQQQLQILGKSRRKSSGISTSGKDKDKDKTAISKHQQLRDFIHQKKLDPEKLAKHLQDINAEFQKLPEKFKTEAVLQIQASINSIIQDLFKIAEEDKLDQKTQKEREELRERLQRINSEVDKFQEKLQNEELGKLQQYFNDEFNQILKLDGSHPNFLKRKSFSSKMTPLFPGNQNNLKKPTAKELKEFQDNLNEKLNALPSEYQNLPSVVQLKKHINSYINKELGIDDFGTDPSKKEELLKILQNINEKVDHIQKKVQDPHVPLHQDSFNTEFIKNILKIPQDDTTVISQILKRKTSLKTSPEFNSVFKSSLMSPEEISKHLTELDAAFDALPPQYRNLPVVISLHEAVANSLLFLEKNRMGDTEKKQGLIENLKRVNSEVNRLQEFLADPQIGLLHDHTNNEFNKLLQLNHREHPDHYLRKRPISMKLPLHISTKDLEELRKKVNSAIDNIPEEFKTPALLKMREEINNLVNEIIDSDINNHPQKRLNLIQTLKKINEEADKLQEKVLNAQIHSLQNQMNLEFNIYLELDQNDNIKLKSKPIDLNQPIELKLKSKDLEMHKRKLNNLINSIPENYQTTTIQKLQTVINGLLDPLIEQVKREEEIEMDARKDKVKGHLAEINQHLEDIHDKLKHESLRDHQKELNKEYFQRFGDFLYPKTKDKKHRKLKLGKHRPNSPVSVEEIKKYLEKINEEFSQIPPEEMTPALIKNHEDIKRTLAKLIEELEGHGPGYKRSPSQINQLLNDSMNYKIETYDLRDHVDRINQEISLLQNKIHNPELTAHHGELNDEFERLLGQKLSSKARKEIKSQWGRELRKIPEIDTPALQRHAERIDAEFNALKEKHQTEVVKKVQKHIKTLIYGLRDKRLGLDDVDITSPEEEKDRKLLRKQKERINKAIDRLQSKIKHVEIAKFQVYLNQEINRILKEDPSKDSADASKYFIGASTRRNTSEIIHKVTLEELKYDLECVNREVGKIPERYMTDYIRKLRDGINDAIEELKKRIMLGNENSAEGRIKNAIHDLDTKFKETVEQLQAKIIEDANTFDVQTRNNCDVNKFYKEKLDKEVSQLRDQMKHEVERLREKLRLEKEIQNKFSLFNSINQLEDSVQTEATKLTDIINSLGGNLRDKIKTIKVLGELDRYKKKWRFRMAGNKPRWLTSKKNTRGCSSRGTGTCTSRTASGKFYTKSTSSRTPNIGRDISNSKSAFDPTSLRTNSVSTNRLIIPRDPKFKGAQSMKKEAQCGFFLSDQSAENLLRELEENKK